MIAELTGKYRFLSNFWSCYVPYYGRAFPSVENAYQAEKCADPNDVEYFLTCKSSEAKKRGKVVRMKKNWDEIKLDIMYQLVRIKFSSYPLKGLLLDTGEEEIEEGNWWGDTYWGTVNGVGENHLGKILMKVRKELRELETIGA